MIAAIFSHSLENLVNQALRLDPASGAAMKKLAGQAVALKLQGLDIQVYLLLDEQILVLADYTGEVNAGIQAPPFTLLYLLTQPTVTLANQSDVVLAGNTGLIYRLAQIFKQLDLDWEAVLAQFFGNSLAHPLNYWLQKTKNYTQTQWQTAQLNWVEFFQEEAKYLPPPAEVQHFFQAVDTLRDDIARLTQRVHYLQKRLT